MLSRSNSNQNFESKDEGFFERDLHPGWLEHKALLINIKLFEEMGLLAVTLPGDNNTALREMAKDNTFYLGDKKLEIREGSSKSTKQIRKLLHKLSASMEEKAVSGQENNPVISNPERRDEVFVPLLLQELPDSPSVESAVHVNPWLSKGTSAQFENTAFNGFTQYVTAGCLFGANLKLDCGKGEWPLIKHEIEFYPGQKIQYISYNAKEANAYEAALFVELKKSVRLMKQHKRPNAKASCLYHLPYYDYMLFGISLFLKGRMTFNALDTLFTQIRQKKSEHVFKIKSIFHQCDIAVTIGSPFDELFGAIEGNHTTHAILAMLGLSSDEINPLTDEETLKSNEREFVKRCLDILKCTGEHQTIWCDFASATGEDRITTLEHLFKIANSYMVAKAASGKESYETCSLLPATEKQIQLGYQSCSNKFAKANPLDAEKYPAVFNMTVLDPVLGYNRSSKGRLFYFDNVKENLAPLIKDIKFMNAASHNAACAFFRSADPKENTEPRMTPVTLKQALFNRA